MKIVAKYHILSGVQWTGENEDEVRNFVDDDKPMAVGQEDQSISMIGQHYARLNDWILKDRSGLKFVVNPDIFEKSYEVINES